MSLKEVVNQLENIIREELRLGEGMKITYDTTLEEIGVDSITMMQLLVFIEERFGFEFGEDALLRGNMMCIHDLVDYILPRIQEDDNC
ncbi:acyl carrier protein [Pelosinus fermentans]|uniref:Acyl carrier protein familyprotein n=1 Tax=Pelosinus fermentans JBW45 TaxID=1192197 RepID=I9NRT1_9FIRM|nr:acyl carrier protein [Pelosinus fermentans]AJQ26588.1 acyl carrier protein familyprotein [Pelosinus fermentans JBW45]